MYRIALFVVTAAVVAGFPASVIAQGASASAGTAEGEQAPPRGTAPAFVVSSDDGDNRLQLGAIVQADARFAIDDTQHNVANTFTIRRLRAITQGRVARYFEFFLNVDFAGGGVNVRDAFLDTVFSRAFRVRVGKMKVPFSYDRNLLITNILFVERGLTTTVAPDRDTGVQVLGDLADNTLSYGVSLTNGVVDGGSSDLDTNESKDLAGRLVVTPWGRDAGSRLNRLGVAMAASTGTQGTPLPSFQTSGRQTFFSYAGAAGDGRRTRVSPQGFYYHGPFWGYAEFVRSRGGVQKDGVTGNVDHDAWQVAASWVLTGEAAAGERNVRPRVNFDPPSRHFGALQVAGRVQRLSVGREAVTRGLATANSSRTADVWAAAVNWYLNPFVKWNFDFERTVFDGDTNGARQPENAALIRAQLAF